jgi:hypothetical protein
VPNLVGFNNDKAQLKRFTANKFNMKSKIRQLECVLGAYVQHNKSTNEIIPCPQESLALYITPNPRSNKRAGKILAQKLIDLLTSADNGYSVHREGLSAIQKAKSRTVVVDFDFDGGDLDSVINHIKTNNCINLEAIKVLITRGGFHLLVYTDLIKPEFKRKNWHGFISVLEGCDVTGDNMIPVPGTYQGGFTPYFKPITIEEDNGDKN